jgi:Intracellular proteinase inhibitor
MLQLLAAAMIFFTMPLQSFEASINKMPFDFKVMPQAGTEKMEIEIALKNTANYPLSFEFMSSQFYEVEIFNQKGEKVYSSSEGKAFLQAIQTIDVKPDESKVWKEHWDYRQKGERVDEGEYTVKARLLASNLNGKKLVRKAESKAAVYIPGEIPVFRHVKITGENGLYSVEIDGHPKSGKVWYSVEDGHNELLSEKGVSALSKNGEKFNINVSISSDRLPENGTVLLHLYEKDMEGNIINSFPVILERR